MVRRTTSQWVGLDLGSRAIKLAHLEQTPAGIRVLKTLVQELPAAPGSQAVDRAGWLTSALKEFPAQPVHVAVAGPEVAIRRVTVPLMSAQELPEAVKWQVKDQVSFPIQPARIAFQMLGEVWDKDIKKQDVLVAAAAGPFIQEAAVLVERAGARVASVTPSQAALWRCATVLVPEARKGSVAVIELGARKTEVAIGKDGRLRLVREVAIGSDHLTDALVGVVAAEAREVTIDRAKAEALKRRYGVIAEGAEGATDEGVPLFQLSSLMRPVLEGLVTELSRMLDFYKSQMDEVGVTRLLLSGGGASLKHLPPHLAQELGVSAEVFNPLLRLPDRAQAMEPEQVAELGPRLAVAVGTALDHGQALDLGPERVASSGAGAAVVNLSRLKRLGVLVFGLLAIGSAALLLISGSLGWRIHQAQARWAQVEPMYLATKQRVADAKMLTRLVDQVARFSGNQPLWDGILKELGELTPSTVTLDSLTLAPHETRAGVVSLRLKGRAVAKGGEGSVAAFVQALEQSLFFARVELLDSEMRTNEGWGQTFEIGGILE